MFMESNCCDVPDGKNISCVWDWTRGALFIWCLVTLYSFAVQPEDIFGIWLRRGLLVVVSRSCEPRY